MKTPTALLSVLLLAVFLSAAAAYTLKTSDVPVTSLDLSTISGATLLDGATLFQDSRPIPQNLSTGSFSFKFYNSTITKISLHPNGVLYFNPTAEELSPFNKPGAILGSGAGSTCPYPSNLTKFEQGFSFCLPSGYDYTWDSAMSVVYYHTFEAGACPFTPKASEACLVVQYFDAGTSDGATGNITAIVFSSGDFFSQVSTPAGAAWFGYQFGIQDLQTNQGVTFPSSEFCSATATILAPGDPWNFGIPSLDLTPGTTFNFFIAADCESGQVARDDGLGCTTPPSHSAGSSLSAAWIDSALLL